MERYDRDNYIDQILLLSCVEVDIRKYRVSTQSAVLGPY
jgi:hypothetical protein